MMIKTKTEKRRKHKKLSRNIPLEELLVLLPWFMIIDGGILIVSAFVYTDDLAFLAGLMLGSLLSLGRYYSLAVSADNAVRRQPDKAQLYMAAMFAVRYIGTFAVLVICVVSVKANVAGLIIPLIYPAVIIHAGNLIKK